MKEKKSILFIILTIIVIGVAGTFAYYTSTAEFENVFVAAKWDIDSKEVFESPENWKPGDVTQKEITVKNNGSITARVRVSLDEEWKDKSGNLLPLVHDGEEVAIINFSNTEDWIKCGDYYYYIHDLEEGDETSPLIDSVTFNENYKGDITCVTLNDGHGKKCSSSLNSYGGGTYSLKAKIETVQKDAYESVWDTSTCDFTSERDELYTVFLDTDGAISPIYKLYVNNGDTYEDVPTISKDGHSFRGWYTDKTYTQKIEKTDIVNLTGNQTLYAKFIPLSELAYNVNFTSNDINCSLSNDYQTLVAEYGQIINNVAIPNPECTGYTFNGWNASNNISLNTAKYGITSVPETPWVNGNKGTYFKALQDNGEDVTLTASWNVNDYTIIFNGNGATSGNVENKTCTYNVNCILPENKFEKEGYLFLGWSTSSNGDLVYEDKDEVINLSSGEEVELFAKWRKLKEATFITGKEFNKYVAVDWRNNFSGNIFWSKSLPDNFIASSDNTVSIDNGEPIYIWYDKEEEDYYDAYLYTDADIIYLNEDSSHMFKHVDGSNSILTFLSSVNTSKVTDMSYMFYDYDTWDANFDLLLNWDTSKVTNMSHMFASSCGDNSNIDFVSTAGLSNWDTSNVTDMSYMFSVSTIYDLSGLSNWDTSKVTDMSYMFGETSILEHDLKSLSNWDTSNVTNMKGMLGMYFSPDGDGPESLDGLQNWNTSKVTDMSHMFFARTSNCGEGYYYSSSDLIDISALSSWDTSNVSDMSYMFSLKTGLKDISALSSWDTSSVTNMSYMFAGSNGLTNLNGLQNWDTSNVTDMSGMFGPQDAYNMVDYKMNLTDISALSNWDTSNVTDMSSMFEHCTSLTDISALSSWDTSNVTDMRGMFSYCSSLTSLNGLQNWNTSKVVYFGYYDNYDYGDGMFYKCSNLIDISALSSWDTSSVTDMSYMFDECNKIQGTFAIKGNPVQYRCMFYGAATSGSGVVVNYSRNTTNIDSIISTKSNNSKVYKGQQID